MDIAAHVSRVFSPLFSIFWFFFVFKVWKVFYYSNHSRSRQILPENRNTQTDNSQNKQFKRMSQSKRRQQQQVINDEHFTAFYWYRHSEFQFANIYICRGIQIALPLKLNCLQYLHCYYTFTQTAKNIYNQIEITIEKFECNSRNEKKKHRIYNKYNPKHSLKINMKMIKINEINILFSFKRDEEYSHMMSVSMG